MGNADLSLSKHTPETTRFDRDHWPAWIEAHPELFAKSVLEFLAEHPVESWACRMRLVGSVVRLTAAKRDLAEPWHECELRIGPQEVVFRFGTEAESRRFYSAREAIALAINGA